MFFLSAGVFLFQTVALLILFPAASHAEGYIKKQSVRIVNESVIIEYDLPEEERFKTTLRISVDGGEKFDFVPSNISGDIGSNLSGRLKKIVWEFKKDGVLSDSGRFLFQLEAFPQPFDMVPVAGGCFDMGDTFGEGWQSERPVHKVCVGDFYISSHEVTQGEWKSIMNSNPSAFAECGDNCPVENISLLDVFAFIKALNMKTDRYYRLPTEGEWEYAARNGGENVRFGTGKNTLSDRDANFDARINFKEPYSEPGEIRGTPLEVGSFLPNSLELYDMAGNVWEWLNDRFSNDTYDKTKSAPQTHEFVVIRGGGWKDKPKNLRTARRSRVYPRFKSSDLGFRLAATKF